MTKTKICTKCNKEKPLTGFYKQRNKCKECCCKQKKKYNKKNKEKIAKTDKKYYEKNKDIISEKNKIYREKNKENIKVKRKKWEEKNQIKIKNKRKKHYLENKDKAREQHLKYTYGITLKIYNEKLKEQKKRCDICGKHIKKEKINLAVDHDHTTGQIRGLLCWKCNTSLGIYENGLIDLNKFEKYLDKWK